MKYIDDMIHILEEAEAVCEKRSGSTASEKPKPSIPCDWQKFLFDDISSDDESQRQNFGRDACRMRQSQVHFVTMLIPYLPGPLVMAYLFHSQQKRH